MVDDELQGFADAATLKSRYAAQLSAFLLGLVHLAKTHPDAGGSGFLFKQVENAFEILKGMAT